MRVFSLYPLLSEKKVFFHSTFPFVEKRGFMKIVKYGWQPTVESERNGYADWVQQRGM
jgi:hypothetical protein